MDFNERFVTGPDNQWPWPLWGLASVYFPAKILRIASMPGSANQRVPAGKSRLRSCAKNTKAPIVSRGFRSTNLVPDAVCQTPLE